MSSSKAFSAHSRRTRGVLWVTTFALLLLAPAPAAAQPGDVRNAPVERSMQIHVASWLMGLAGTVRPSASGPTATIDASSNPVAEFDASPYATMLYRRNRLALVADLSGFSSTDAARQAAGEQATVTQRLQVLTVTPGYAWRDGARGSLATFGGVRIWRMNNAVFVPELELYDAARTSYYDVVFGTRAEGRLAKAVTASAYADAGGFQIASHLTWQAVATLSVRTSEQWSLVGSYRHLSVDYRGDGKFVRLKMYGPSVGAAIRF